MNPLADMISELRRRQAAVLEQEIAINRFLARRYGESVFGWKPGAFPPGEPERPEAVRTRQARGAHLELARELIAPLDGQVFDARRLCQLRRAKHPEAAWFNPYSALLGLHRKGEIERAPGGFRRTPRA